MQDPLGQVDPCPRPADRRGMTPALRIESRRWSGGESCGSVEAIAEETPVALVYNGISHAVMMATPQDLEDFALGFSLTEGILERPDELLDCEARVTARGIEIQAQVTTGREAAIAEHT